MSSMKPNELIGLKEAAVILDREASWVRRLCDSGSLPAIKIGTSWGVRRGVAERYAQAHPKRIFNSKP